MDFLLERIANGDYSATKKGFFQSSASDSDYEKFIEVAEYLVEFINDDGTRYKNIRNIEYVKNKRLPMVSIEQGIISPKLSDFYKEPVIGKPVDDVINMLVTRYDLYIYDDWWITYQYMQEISRCCGVIGKIGDSVLNITINCKEYRRPLESATFTISIAKMTNFQRKRLEKYKREYLKRSSI